MQRKVVSRRERPAKKPLSRAAVVKAALVILEKEGLEKVTMRRIAAALETGPASLYVYVKDTRDLHAQILDALVAGLPAPKPGKHWRRDLAQVTEAYLLVLMRYPEIARMTMSTHSTGASSMRMLDTIAGLLLEGGAGARAASWGLDLVLAFVTATVVEHGGRRDDGDGGGPDLAELQQMVEAVDPVRHPHLAELGPELISGEGLERFHWGLQVLVTGILGTPR